MQQIDDRQLVAQPQRGGCPFHVGGFLLHPDHRGPDVDVEFLADAHDSAGRHHLCETGDLPLGVRLMLVQHLLGLLADHAEAFGRNPQHLFQTRGMES